MRASVAIAQHTMTAEAVNVLKHAISNAHRRGHAQVTPLHVASSLLTTNGSLLRQACLQSHRHLPHPLQCRALELCFNVALERLQTVQGSHVAAPQPSFSNALVAALKRAQAHQRRGCPDQQQVLLLVVKVEMEQLIISILDDPSVSRVMREAGFSSTHVKNSLEEAMGSPSMHSSENVDLSHLKFGYAEPTGNLLKLGGVGSIAQHGASLRTSDFGGLSSIGVNQERDNATFILPLVQTEAHHRNSIAANLLEKTSEVEFEGSRDQAVRGVIDILLRQHKRNPLIIGEPGLATNVVVKELLEDLEKGDIDARLKGVKLVYPQVCTSRHQSKQDMEEELLHLMRVLDQNISSGVIVFLGDVQWLVEGMDVAQQAVAELRRLLLLHEGSGRLWFMGTVAYQTYWRSEARNTSLESEWGFQPVHIALEPRRMLPRFEHPWPPNKTSEVSLRPGWSQAKSPIDFLRLLDDRQDDLSCCPECSSNFENECNLLHEQERTSKEESLHSLSSIVYVSGDKRLPLYAEPENLSTWLQAKSVLHHSNEAVAQNVDEPSHSLPQKFRNLREKWSRSCHSQHKEFHCSRQPAPVLLHELAQSSSSQNPGVKSFEGKLHSESPTCASLDVPAVSSQLRRGCRKLSIAPKPPWLSLQPQPILKFVTDSSSELEVIEMGHVRSLATSPSEVTRKEHLSKSYPEQRLNYQEESELTVQTDLALGRSVEQIKGSIDCASRILWGGRLHNALHKPVRSRKYNISTAGTAEMPVLSWQDRLRHLPEAVPTDICLSKTIADKLRQTAFSFRVVKQVDTDGVQALQEKLKTRVPWQQEAIKAIATAIIQCRSGTGKKRGISVKRDTWLLLLGSDSIGKRNIAKSLAESMFGCQKKLFRISFKKEHANFPIREDFQQHNLDDCRVSNRGKTHLDRIAEAVRLNPLSVVLLEDIDKADSKTISTLSRTMEKGRLQESNGREISFSNVIVAMTSTVCAEKCSKQQSSLNIRFCEERLLAALGCGMRVSVEKEASQGILIVSRSHITVVDYASAEQNLMGGIDQSLSLVASSRRKANGVEATCDAGKKRRKENPAGQLLELDLNLPLNHDDEPIFIDGNFSRPFLTYNQSISDAVLDSAQQCLTTNFCSLFDSIVTFQSFNFDETVKNVLDLLNRTTSVVTASRARMEIDFTVIEHLVAAVWEGSCDKVGLETWTEQVLEPCLSDLFRGCKVLPDMVVKLVSKKAQISKDCLTISGLPKSISIGSGI
ncbi:hypothetical protein O6H91_02G140500 [Diphasiastrum complanatum]|uniref:Uncharacterized protein n=1 Tax=Diphasiastrum complanatum TaxID=34168 RepID=A0ACC2ELJ9_DIPCM|nr:hypothetical protein O6H91_02G140500 [Diphasiastrum complanatum]